MALYTASSAFRWALSPGIDWNVPLVSPSSFQKKRAAPVAGFTPQATRILSSCPECSGLKLSDHPSPPHDSLPPKQKKCSPYATGITHESYTLYCYHTKIGPKFQTFFEQKLPRFSPPSFVKILQSWPILRPTGADQTNSRDGEGRPCCSCILTRFGPRASRSYWKASYTVRASRRAASISTRHFFIVLLLFHVSQIVRFFARFGYYSKEFPRPVSSSAV